MSKGTPSMGKKSGKKTHIMCRRCGGHTFHCRKKRCSSCGYGNSSRLRTYSWQKK
ncbi:50S ribosomal protein L37e [Candidatus Woesearchaeota archaeon]|nr:50S ribosomal protein L37e [Candidatus Woesearchaeota archaeon]